MNPCDDVNRGFRVPRAVEDGSSARAYGVALALGPEKGVGSHYCDLGSAGYTPRLARKHRVQYEGAIYHVMNRGDRP